jgi:hypothetical protein
MPTRVFYRICLSAMLIFSSGLFITANAERISIIDAPVPPNSSEGIMRPTNNMTMSQVREKFGEPKEELAPVGDPPITRWVYDGYTVYFEGNRVIHSVVHHS